MKLDNIIGIMLMVISFETANAQGEEHLRDDKTYNYIHYVGGIEDFNNFNLSELAQGDTIIVEGSLVNTICDGSGHKRVWYTKTTKLSSDSDDAITKTYYACEWAGFKWNKKQIFYNTGSGELSTK